MSTVATQGSENAAKPYDQFLLFGDSITEMSYNQALGFAFGAQLQEVYSRRLDVINRGFGGYTTAHAIQVLPHFFPAPQTANREVQHCDLTSIDQTIFFGANDACVPTHEQHVPVAVYKENLQKIIHHPLVRAQDPRIIIITPPPVNEYQLEDFDNVKETPHPSRTAESAKRYAEAAKEVGASLNVPVADVWSEFMTAAGWQEGQALVGSRDVPNSEKFASLFTDGLHLTPEGYRIVFDEVLKVIRANYPDQAPEVLSMVFPAWGVAPK
ncbi:Esterase SGNH hydrolase-type subgroup [Penicillium macrosclerotiorum]|uniref:Esterase SGNH hydrolase-type subgroup n=1 Tax=Penicillium macrosclerotiorum TaxID=303699 RepID=UPI002549B06F|nr:Esterase SGNH hydrolase-type subgroup [Penicillium macrosclerotiorum]KAJ5669049.1 Esterase SGNH hydrolase-type subgroup [Penicillium macrosclerotiorum]